MAQNRPKIKLADRTWKKLYATQEQNVKALAEKIADGARDKVPDDVPIEVRTQPNIAGRPVALVTIIHPSGVARQAKHGVLTMSAAELGADITRYPVPE